MKKFLLILLAAGLVLSLCACGGGTKEAVSAAAADANSALTDAALAVSAAEGVQDAASQAPAAESAQETASQALPGVQNVVSAALQEQLGIVNSQTDPAESIAACEIRPSISLLQLESYVRGETQLDILDADYALAKEDGLFERQEYYRLAGDARIIQADVYGPVYVQKININNKVAGSFACSAGEHGNKILEESLQSSRTCKTLLGTILDTRYNNIDYTLIVPAKAGLSEEIYWYQDGLMMQVIFDSDDLSPEHILPYCFAEKVSLK